MVIGIFWFFVGIVIVGIYCLQAYRYKRYTDNTYQSKQDTFMECFFEGIPHHSHVNLFTGKSLQVRTDYDNININNVNQFLKHSIELSIQVTEEFITTTVSDYLYDYSVTSTDAYVERHVVLLDFCRNQTTPTFGSWLAALYKDIRQYADVIDQPVTVILELIEIHLSWPPDETVIQKRITAKQLEKRNVRFI